MLNGFNHRFTPVDAHQGIPRNLLRWKLKLTFNIWNSGKGLASNKMQEQKRKEKKSMYTYVYTCIIIIHHQQTSWTKQLPFLGRFDDVSGSSSRIKKSAHLRGLLMSTSTPHRTSPWEEDSPCSPHSEAWSGRVMNNSYYSKGFYTCHIINE